MTANDDTGDALRGALDGLLIAIREVEEEAKADLTSGSRSAHDPPTINETAPPPALEAIVVEWRAVERRLQAAEAASPEADESTQEFEGLRDRYAAALRSVGNGG